MSAKGIALAEEELSALKRIKGRKRALSPEELFDAVADDPKSPLRHRYEWDGEVAVRELGVRVSRQIIQAWKIRCKLRKPKNGIKEVTVPALVSIGEGYLDVETVMSDPRSADAQLLYDWHRIESLLVRIEDLSALSDEHEHEDVRLWAKEALRGGRLVFSGLENPE
jgi:hypothetical protein